MHRNEGQHRCNPRKVSNHSKVLNTLIVAATKEDENAQQLTIPMPECTLERGALERWLTYIHLEGEKEIEDYVKKNWYHLLKTHRWIDDPIVEAYFLEQLSFKVNKHPFIDRVTIEQLKVLKEKEMLESSNIWQINGVLGETI
jgi:hypothetical protein